jgi:hypothetical protein
MHLAKGLEFRVRIDKTHGEHNESYRKVAPVDAVFSSAASWPEPKAKARLRIS